jgi:hypothetical protein
MAAKSRDLKSDQQESPIFMRLPAEIRLYIYDLALEDILTQIESTTSCYYLNRGTKLDCRGALALLLTSKAIRAESSDGVLPLATAHCENFSSRVQMLHLDWEVKITAPGHPQPGQGTTGIIQACLDVSRQEWQRTCELGDAHAAMQDLYKVKRIMERTAEESKSNINSSGDVEDENSKPDA